MKKLFVILVVSLVTFSIAAPVQAHGGRTDSNGCHYDHKRGGKHCH